MKLDDFVSPLTSASFLGRIEMVSYLLENSNCNPNLATEPNRIFNNIEYTPLIAACLSGSYECCKIILENGGDPNLPDSLSKIMIRPCTY